jgi:DNA repair protein RAD50
VLGIDTRFSRKNDRESKTVSNEVDRQSQLIRDLENDLHSMELEERDLLSKAKEKERYEQDIDRMTEEIGANAIRQKVRQFFLWDRSHY